MKKQIKYSNIVAWLALFSLVISMFTGIISGDSASAKVREFKSDRAARKSAHRVSPDLRERGLRARNRGQEETVKVILQAKGPISGKLNKLLTRNGVRVKGHFQEFNSYVVELPVSVVAELETYSDVLYVSLDKPMKSLGHVSQTTGAAQVRTQTTPTPYTLDGSGVAIAVLDSVI